MHQSTTTIFTIAFIAFIFAITICSFQYVLLASIKDIIIPFVCRYDRLQLIFAGRNNSMCRTSSRRSALMNAGKRSDLGDVVYFVEPFEQRGWSLADDENRDTIGKNDDYTAIRVAPNAISMTKSAIGGIENKCVKSYRLFFIIEYDNEALASLHVAIDYRHKGNYQKV